MAEAANEKQVEEWSLNQFDFCFCCHVQMFVFLLSDKIFHAQYLFGGGKYTVNTRLIPPPTFWMVPIPEIRAIGFLVQSLLWTAFSFLLVEPKRTG